VLVLKFRVRAGVSVKVRARVRDSGYETPGYENFRVRNVLKPKLSSCIHLHKRNSFI